MAREAGFETMLRKGKILGFDRDGDYTEELKAFEALVRADERNQALEAPTVQEPVAWMMKWPNHSPSFTTDKSDYVSWFAGKASYPDELVPLYTTPPAQPAPVQKPVAIIEQLWAIIDDIDTYGDMAKNDDKAFRAMVERRQKDRWSTGITTDGYTLNVPTPPAQPAPVQPMAHIVGEIDHAGKVWKPN
jgi:hypothetical protein